jgi:hypothetical protein
VIGKVLGPYVDSVKARLDALQDVQNAIASLVESINAFYVDKSVTFNIQKGLQIKTKDGEPLKPTMLSSGERPFFSSSVTRLWRSSDPAYS